MTKISDFVSNAQATTEDTSHVARFIIKKFNLCEICTLNEKFIVFPSYCLS